MGLYFCPWNNAFLAYDNNCHITEIFAFVDHHSSLLFSSIKFYMYLKLIFAFIIQKAFSTVGTPDYIAPEVLLKKGYGMECDWLVFILKLY